MYHEPHLPSQSSPSLVAERALTLQAMKIKAIKVVAVITLLIAATLLPLLTVGNAGWHVRRVFPKAKVYFEPVNSPDFTFSALLRMVIPTCTLLLMKIAPQTTY